MADSLPEFLQTRSPRDDLRGFGWARLVLVFFGIGGLLTSVFCVGIPLLYGVVLGWRAVDQAQAYVESGNAELAQDSARKFSQAMKFGAIGYLLLIGAYVGAVIVFGVIGALSSNDFNS